MDTYLTSNKISISYSKNKDTIFIQNKNRRKHISNYHRVQNKRI